MGKSNVSTSELDRYARFGLAALIPGMQHMLKVMEGEMERIREMLAQAQGVARVVKPQGRPVAGGRSGWSEDPEERKKEMARRFKKRKANQAAARKSAAISKAASKRWEAMSPKARKERLAKMAAGKKAKQLPVAKLEAIA